MKALFYILICLAASRAFATDGNNLLAVCSAVEIPSPSAINAQDISYCYGFIAGALETNYDWQSMVSHDGNHSYDAGKLCVPGRTVTSIQSARIVLKYLRDHPENLHYSGSVIVHNAFHGAFSCQP